MPPTRHNNPPLTHLSRRRSSLGLLSSKSSPKAGIYTPSPPPPRLTFYPNVTPTTYVSQEDQDRELDQLALHLKSEISTPVSVPLFPPSSTINVPGPTKPPRKRQPPGKRRSQGYIPRPPNAFMLFRADFVKQKHVPGSIETNHGSLSKIIGSCWRSLPPEQKLTWEILARQEKQAHKEKYPDYKFKPVHKKRKNVGSDSLSKSKSKRSKADPVEDVEFEFDDEEAYLSEYEPPKSHAKSTKLSPCSSSLPTSVDSSPPTAYPPTSYRFAYATLREARQEFTVQCLLNGIKKRPYMEAAASNNVEYLEDCIARWDVERGYVEAKKEAEREEREEREVLVAGVKSEPSATPTFTKSFLGHRRSSSVPIPEQFVHNHLQQNLYTYPPVYVQQPYAAGYYPTVQPQTYTQGYDGTYMPDTDPATYTPYTNSNWGTHVEHLPAPVPTSSTEITLPRLPSFSLTFPPPSPSLSSSSSSGPESHVNTNRYILGQRRASSAQPCLLQHASLYQYQQEDIPFYPYSYTKPDPSVWGLGAQPQPQIVSEPQDEMMVELGPEEIPEFDPSAMSGSGLGGWNPHFSFSNSSSSETETQVDVGNATPLLTASLSSASSLSLASLSPIDTTTATIPVDPVDPLDPSPISSSCSPLRAHVQHVHAPQPITPAHPINVEDISMDDLAYTSSESSESPAIHSTSPAPPSSSETLSIHAPGPKLTVESTTPEPEPESASDPQQIFTDLWKGLASSKSFCMGSALGMGFGFRPSVAFGNGSSGDCPTESPAAAVNEDEEEEEEDGEFEKALRREHKELLAVGGC